MGEETGLRPVQSGLRKLGEISYFVYTVPLKSLRAYTYIVNIICAHTMHLFVREFSTCALFCAYFLIM